MAQAVRINRAAFRLQGQTSRIEYLHRQAPAAGICVHDQAVSCQHEWFGGERSLPVFRFKGQKAVAVEGRDADLHMARLTANTQLAVVEVKALVAKVELVALLSHHNPAPNHS